MPEPTSTVRLEPFPPARPARRGSARPGERNGAPARSRTTRRGVPPVALIWLLLILVAIPGRSQPGQYTGLAGLSERPEDPQEKLEEAVAEAPWQVGPLRLQPWLGIRDLSYVDNVFSTAEGIESDLTATVGAGLKAYLPLGKATLVAHALPEYVWWAEQDQYNRLAGRYGVGLFGYFNRLTLEASAQRLEQQRIVSPELEQRVTVEQDTAAAELELALTRRFFLFAGGVLSDLTHDLDELDDPRVGEFDRLDREEESWRGGVRWRPPGSLRLGVGVEEMSVDFTADPRRSYDGNALLLEVGYESGRIFGLLELAQRELEGASPAGAGASPFPPFDEITGRLLAELEISGRSQLALYAGRNVAYSISSDYAYSLDERTGLVWKSEIGDRNQLSVYAEIGDLDYTAFTDAAPPPRRDDVVGYGADMTFRFGRRGQLTLGARVTDYDSNLPGFDRQVVSVVSGISIVGSGISPWW